MLLHEFSNRTFPLYWGKGFMGDTSEKHFEHQLIHHENDDDENGRETHVLVQRTVGRRKADAEAGWYKSACLFMAGILVTLIGMWFTYIRNGVSRDDVNGLIASHPTIVSLTKDMKTTSERVGNVESTLDDVNTNLIHIADAVGVNSQHTRKPKVRTSGN